MARDSRNMIYQTVLQDSVDLSGMEKALGSLIMEEEKYKRENDAKFRAVAQNVPTYDQFRDIVKASHLKPLETQDKNLRPKKIWNTLNCNSKAEEREQVVRCFVGSHVANNELLQIEIKIWQIDVAKERYKFLRSVEKEKLQMYASSDLCAQCLGLVFTSLAEMEETIDDYYFVIYLLELLMKPVHFNRSLSLLNAEDEAACRNVFHMLEFIRNISANSGIDLDDVKFNTLTRAYRI